jgi:membrane fusion protein, multidrug efflux system
MRPLTILLFGVLALIGCQNDSAPAGGNSSGAPSGSTAAAPGAGPARGGPPSASAGPVLVKIETIALAPLSDTISALGTTAARESVTISAKVTETVSRINFNDGDAVNAGDVLVELSGKAELAALKEAQAGFLEATQQFARFSDLRGKGTVTQAQVDTAKATVDQNKARLDAVRARLSDRVITAPFSGVLGFRRVSPGTLLTPGTAIVTLDDIDTLQLDFTVPETELANVRVGDVVSARSQAYPDQRFEGEVRSIDSRVDPGTRAFAVRALLQNPRDSAGRYMLKPGMLLNVRLSMKPREALMVSEIAVVQNGDRAFVYRYAGDNQAATQVDLQLGTRRDGKVEVLNGLSAGDQIITEGNVKLRPNMPVRAAPAESASS